MLTKQQQEALEYFSENAGDWKRQAERGGNTRVNVIQQRNSYVLQVADERAVTRSFLDVGCGTGELVNDVAKRGIKATGVDYAPEMIDISRMKSRDDGIVGAKFLCCSIFDFEMQREGYDLISANGFIEYISQREMLAFFERVAAALTPGGSFVVGSRNRLFDLVSMNEFTLQETDSDGRALLFREAVKWTNVDGMPVVVKEECAPLQPPESIHPTTGIKVATRFQYSPFQLISLLQDKGLRTEEVYAVHIHGVTPKFKERNLEVHASIANLLQAYARRNTQLLAHASSFMLHVKKA